MTTAIKTVKAMLPWLGAFWIGLGAVCLAQAPASGGHAPAGARQHPYLYVTAEELPALREKLKTEPFATQWGRFLAHAEKCLTARLTPATHWLNHSRESLGVAGTTAFAYLVTGDRRFGERAKRELLQSLSAERWTGSFFLVVGERCAGAALVYDWCYDLFTPEERRTVIAAIERLGLEPYLTGIEGNHWWVKTPVTNWRGVGHGGCGLAALALAGESEKAARAAKLAWEHAQEYLRHVMLEDGGGHEGIMYWRYGASYTLKFLSAATRLRGEDAGWRQVCVDRLAGYWDIYLHGPDRRYANFNNITEDTFAGLYGKDPGQLSGGPSAALAALFESMVPGGDPLLLWAADNGGHNYLFGGGEPFWFLWRRVAPPAGPKPELQRNVLFRGAGHAILSSPSLWFAMHGGWNNTSAHFNVDLGTFVLVANGERLVNDLGYGFISTADHSTLVFGGLDQPKGPRGKCLRFGEGDGFAYAACDLSGVNVEGKVEKVAIPGRPVERWVRHAVLVGDAFLVLMDDVQLSGPCDVEWRLQSRRRIAADPAARAATIKGEANVLHVSAAWPLDAAVSAREREAKTKPGAPKGVPVHTLSFKAGQPALQTRYVAVLYPQPAGGEAPRVVADADGKLTVEAKGRRHTLRFGRTDAGWMLAEVNGMSAAGIPAGTERSVRRVPAAPASPGAPETRPSTGTSSRYRQGRPDASAASDIWDRDVATSYSRAVDHPQRFQKR